MPLTQNSDLAALRERLLTLPQLGGVDVIIYQQGVIDSELSQGLGKVSGLCLVLVSNGLTRPKAEAGSRWELEVQLDIWTAPTLQAEGSPHAQPINDLVEAVIVHLDDWQPFHAPGCWTWTVLSAKPRTENGMLVWGLRLQADRPADLSLQD